MNIAQMIKDGEPAVAAAVEALTQPPLRQAGAPATTDALVRQMREALLECLEWLEGEGLEIPQEFPARVAVAAADQWLAGQPADPMDWPLPCDVKVGHGTNAKGTKLRSLVARTQALYDTVQASQAVAQPLTDEQILDCVRSVGVPAPMGLTRDRGPYEITEPSWFLTQLVHAIERAHGIGQPAGGTK